MILRRALKSVRNLSDDFPAMTLAQMQEFDDRADAEEALVTQDGRTRPAIEDEPEGPMYN